MYGYILRSTAVVVELTVIISKIMYIMMVDANLAAGWPANTDPQGFSYKSYAEHPRF